MCRCRSLLHWQLNSLQFFYLWDIKGRNRHLYVQNNFLCCRNKVCGDCIVPSACTQGNTLWCGFILNQVLYETQKKFYQFSHLFLADFHWKKISLLPLHNSSHDFIARPCCLTIWCRSLLIMRHVFSFVTIWKSLPAFCALVALGLVQLSTAQPELSSSWGFRLHS